MASPVTPLPKIELPSLEIDAAIVAAAIADPDAPPLTDEQLALMVPMKLLPRR